MIMLKDAKSKCDILVVCLQTDPTLDRPHKNKPIQSFEEREIVINGVKYIDEIIIYSTEYDYYHILEYLKPEIRIIGSDWEGKLYIGHDIKEIPVYFHARTHNWLTSGLRKKIYEAEKAKLIHS